MKIVLKNKNYLILFATNCLLNGSINGFLVVIKLVNKPFGFGSVKYKKFIIINFII